MSVASSVSYTGHFCLSCSESLLVLIIIIITIIEMRHYFPPVFFCKKIMICLISVRPSSESAANGILGVPWNTGKEGLLGLLS